jgi:hypothetical protein
LGAPGAKGAAGALGAPGALGAVGALGAAFIAAMICASVAPQFAHSFAVEGFMKLQMGHSMSGAAVFSSVPQSTHTFAMGLFIFPHLGQLFIWICAGLKHIISPFVQLFRLFCIVNITNEGRMAIESLSLPAKQFILS